MWPRSKKKLYVVNQWRSSNAVVLQRWRKLAFLFVGNRRQCCLFQNEDFTEHSLCFGCVCVCVYVCVCVCVCVCAASNSGPSTEHYSNNTMRHLLDTHFTWCWIGRNRPIACPLCSTGLTPCNFSFGAVWKTWCAPNLLLIIRTCVTESQCYFDYETRYSWTYLCLVWLSIGHGSCSKKCSFGS
jgi:hypothetical protein